MRACPQPIVAAIDGVCAGAGAILAMASDIRIGTARRQGGVPVQPRRPCRLRHGRLRHAAAHHRPGPGRRTAVHRPQHGRRGSGALGLLQPAGRTRGLAGRGADAGQRPRQRTDLRQRHDQADAGDGMGDVGRDGDRGGSGGAGACAWRRKISPAPFAPSPPSRSRCSRATEMANDPRRYPLLAVLRRRPSGRFADELAPLGRAQLPTACRMANTMSMPPAAPASRRSAEAGFLKAVVPPAARRPVPDARRAHALPRTRNPRVPRRPCRFRLRHAGARHRLDHAVRLEPI